MTNITSGKLLVTDPCYKKGTWCTIMVRNVRKGEWQASVVEEGRRIKELKYWHQEASGFRFKKIGSVGVDSGQMGIFDYWKFPQDPHGLFYDIVCRKTLSKKMWGYVKAGVVSSSGWGDGEYPVYASFDLAGRVEAIKVVFL